jgi:hypothetical protein
MICKDTVWGPLRASSIATGATQRTRGSVFFAYERRKTSPTGGYFRSVSMLNVTLTPSTSEPGTHKTEVFSELTIGVLGVFKAGAIFSSFSRIGEFPDGVPGVDISVRFTLPGSFLRALALAGLRSTLIVVKAEVAVLIPTI